LLNLIETVALYDQIRSHPESDWVPRVKIFGGKAAPSYHNAKLSSNWPMTLRGA
jgi:starch phosphorylase